MQQQGKQTAGAQRFSLAEAMAAVLPATVIAQRVMLETAETIVLRLLDQMHNKSVRQTHALLFLEEFQERLVRFEEPRSDLK